MKDKQHFLTIEQIDEFCKNISDSGHSFNYVLAKMQLDMDEDDMSEDNLDSICERIFLCSDCEFYYLIDKMSEYENVCEKCMNKNE